VKFNETNRILIAGVVYLKHKKTSNEADLYPAPEVEKEAVPVVPEKDTASAPQDTNTEQYNRAIKNGSMLFGKGEYEKAIIAYDEALKYGKKDTAYSGLFMTYSAQNNIEKARVALDNAISINPSYTDYWVWKLQLLDEKTDVSFVDLKKIYQDGLSKVDIRTKINLVTNFARMAENNYQKDEAISLWEYAEQLYPNNKDVYQTEIDRLSM
jgi:tetratricopeptide (TPR) repeat protein